MENPFEGTIFGAAKKAFDFGAKLAAQQKEKKMQKAREEEEARQQAAIYEQEYQEEYEEEEDTSSTPKAKANKVAAGAGKMLGRGLKKLWDSAGAH